VFEQKDPENDRFGTDFAQVVTPKVGVLNIFTSGHENKHRVEGVTEGVRYQLAIGFTCNSEHGIPDPSLPEKDVEAHIPDEL